MTVKEYLDNWYRNILVIGPEDNMPDHLICDKMNDLDIDVVCCKDEKELLLKWTELIKDQDPDFITGYNIFGFDFRYIKDRVDIFFECPVYYSSGKCMCSNWGNSVNHHETCPKSQFYNLEVLDWGEINDFDVIINATSLGLNKESINLDFSKVANNKLFYDVIYNPEETNFLKEGKKLGNRTENGKLMFVYQAFEAFKLWHGIEPQINSETLEILKND